MKEAPKFEGGPKALKWLMGRLGKLREFVTESRITYIEVRERLSADEPLGALIQPGPTGTKVKLIVSDGLPGFPTDDGEYLLWVKITGGVVDAGVDPNPTWFGPAPAGSVVLGAIDGAIQWFDTTTC